MYFIGIDISKYKHDCYIEDSNGVVIRDSFSFDNTKEGFEYFLSVVQSLDHSQEIKIGLEATGHYGANLISLLNDNHLTFMEANPLDVKNFIRFKSKRREKNDKIDAKYIAQYIVKNREAVEIVPVEITDRLIKKPPSATDIKVRLRSEISR